MRFGYLIWGKLIAGDSTKLWAQNSKKNNFNQTKIDRYIAYFDNKLEEYTSADTLTSQGASGSFLRHYI